ncbi:PAS domain S-box-containing protein [Malonomonas rubra DSM 5091]|uniref:histidine kinase n=1 Tax=Malonomonas rubra DSM 5091 TaxID=1122189 RepID=A0A1M6JBF7_MALRU|nr:PhnD/SsuA/transferrin family substrate-binding protein [Malonomonas rubra]SHJ44003.1 PAS domain S-box-containing protein [Malonomonas rubra DSM 5091]
MLHAFPSHRQKSKFVTRGSSLLRYLCIIFALLLLVSLAHSHPAPPVKIGVLAKRSIFADFQKWAATASYLSGTIHDRRFEIIPLDFENVRLAVMAGDIDFLITNSSYYVTLEADHGLQRIATLVNLHDKEPRQMFGGVVFTRADRSDISTFKDLIGKHFWAVDQNSLGGWLAAWREFHAQGINPERDFGLLKFSGTHDEVVHAVFNGEADAGTVRTDTLERMAFEGEISLDEVKVLNQQAGDSKFDYLCSTRFYPEWPFAALKHTPKRLVEQVTLALMAMPTSSHAAQTANIAGWTAPLDYQSIHELLKDRHLFLHEKYVGKPTLSTFLKQHWQAGVLVIICICLLSYVAVYKSRLNRQLESRIANRTQALNRLASAVEQSGETIVITDAEAKIEYVNSAFTTVTGYRRDEVIGKNPRILNSGEQDDAVYADLWQTISHGKSWKGRFANKKKDGSRFVEDVNISPIINSEGEIVNYVAVKRDITEQLQIEEQYRQSQKLDAIGKLAGGVAHDFNNMLAIILGQVELLLMKTEADNPLRQRLLEIKNASTRSSELTQQLLGFARKQPHTPRILNLNEAVTTTLNMLKRLIGKHIDVRWRAETEKAFVKIDTGHLNQILTNLIINARDAIDGNGSISIRTAHASLDEKFCQEHLGTKPGEFILVEISDTGCGMNKEVLSKIFDPFFTTKDPSKGTGLGLSMVFGLVKQNNGYIYVQSSEGQGATFSLYFPAVASEIKDPALIENHELVHGSETILVVEDEASILEIARSFLTEAGYNVLSAQVPEEAIKLANNHLGTIELLLTDIIMPKMSGVELGEALLKKHPHLKILYMSGYSGEHLIPKSDAATEPDVLLKPFSAHSLTKKIRAILDSKTSTERI